MKCIVASANTNMGVALTEQLHHIRFLKTLGNTCSSNTGFYFKMQAHQRMCLQFRWYIMNIILLGHLLNFLCLILFQVCIMEFRFTWEQLRILDQHCWHFSRLLYPDVIVLILCPKKTYYGSQGKLSKC